MKRKHIGFLLIYKICYPLCLFKRFLLPGSLMALNHSKCCTDSSDTQEFDFQLSLWGLGVYSWLWAVYVSCSIPSLSCDSLFSWQALQSLEGRSFFLCAVVPKKKGSLPSFPLPYCFGFFLKEHHMLVQKYKQAYMWIWAFLLRSYICFSCTPPYTKVKFILKEGHVKIIS